MPDLRALGPFPSIQIAAPLEDSDLVSQPVAFVAGKHTMQYHNGPTVSAPRLILVWCGVPALNRTRFEQFAKELLECGYLSALGYAHCSGGRYLGSYDGPALQPGMTLLDSALRQALQRWLGQHPEVPQPDGQTIYALMLPDGVTAQFDGSTETSCKAFCGYHQGAQPLLYTVQPASNCAPCNQGDPFVAACMLLAHEVAETVSDPYGTGWFEDSSGMENADIVAWIQKAYGPWTVQGYADPAGNNVLGAYTPPAPAVQQPFNLSLPFWQWLEENYPTIITAIEQADPRPDHVAVFEAWKTWFKSNQWDRVPA